MKNALLLALVSLLLPIIAHADTGEPGRYEGTAVDASGLIRKHVSFHLTVGGRVSNFHVGGHKLVGLAFLVSGGHFTFDRHNDSPVVIRYQGHGKWHGHTHCAGDFREFHLGLTESNIYYTWSAHLKDR
ncbi:MAG TPA: hypothetical protein VNB29_06805 [Chthoniobacterales bacterium]|jgi:hypothetical protein|nr:hypothetical protein [Chthoniobacterales bacterium]